MNSKTRHKERIVYRNGKKLIISNKRIQVKRRMINLVDVIDHGIKSNRPTRIPSLLLIVLGIIAITQVKYYGSYVLAEGTMLDVIVPGIENRVVYLNQEAILQLIGIVLTTVGIILLIFLRKKYAVIVETAKGYKTIALHKKKKHAIDVELAIHEAILYMPPVLFKKAQRREFIKPKPSMSRPTRNTGRLGFQR